MFDMSEMIKQAKKMQEDMKKVSEQLSEETVTTGVSRGAVKVEMNGNMEIRTLVINPELAPMDDAQGLAEMIKAAVNEAVDKAKSMSASKMNSMAGGMNIPGLSKMLGM